MRNSATAILLCLLLTTPVLVTCGWLTYKKHVIRQEVKQRLISGTSKDALVLIKIHLKDRKKLNWEHDREFEYQEEMYDVVHTEQTGDTLYYWCWWDNEETVLNKQLNNLLQQNFAHNHEHQETQAHLIKLVNSLYHHQLTSFQIHRLPETLCWPGCYTAITSYPSCPSTPPPQVS